MVLVLPRNKQVVLRGLLTFGLVQAIKLDPADAVLYSNRSLCYLKCGEEYDALIDANACISLDPKWHKGHYWKGAALMSLLVRINVFLLLYTSPPAL